MNKLILGCMIAVAAHTTVEAQELPVPKNGVVMGKPYELATAPNGALVNKSLMTGYKLNRAPISSKFVKKQIEKVGEGIYSIQGIYLATVTVIETPNGVVVFDTGENPAMGDEIIQLIETATPKPIVAVIYSHSHYVYGTTAIKGKYPNVQIIAHPNVHKNITGGGFGVGSIYPELSPLLVGNGAQQFQMYLPKEGADAPFGSEISMPEANGYVAPTKVVANEEVVTIDGVDFQFFTDYNVDIDDCLLVWMPSKKLTMSNLDWGVMPNLYTLRGSNFREPANWVGGLNKVRELQAHYFMSTHGMPTVGREAVADLVQNYADFFAFVKDQTLRAMLLGKAPQDLGRFVQLPEHMRKLDCLSETYGVMETYPEAIYQNARGWFDGDAANIFKLPRKEEADLMVEAMGGAKKVQKQIAKAQKEGNTIWAMRLSNYLYQSEPTNVEYRNKKAELLSLMGYTIEAQTARGWYLTQANALTGKIALPRLVLPEDLAMQMTPDMLVNQYRVRIDPAKAKDTDMMVAFDIDGVKLGLHCRRGVVEFVGNTGSYVRPADATITLNHKTMVQLFLNQKSFDKFIDGKQIVVHGDESRVKTFFSLFDEVFNPQVNQAIPSL